MLVDNYCGCHASKNERMREVQDAVNFLENYVGSFENRQTFIDSFRKWKLHVYQS
jgi:hypothetical protein